MRGRTILFFIFSRKNTPVTFYVSIYDNHYQIQNDHGDNIKLEKYFNRKHLQINRNNIYSTTLNLIKHF